MENMLERVKKRLAESGSPIRTVKGVATAIDMSESGFYRMLERHTYKKTTLVAIADALGVKEAYLLGETDQNNVYVEKSTPGGLEAVLSELRDLREQLQVKDRQIELRDTQISGLLKTVDALVGKYEGADYRPLSDEELEYQTRMQDYLRSVADQPFMQSFLQPIFLR